MKSCSRLFLGILNAIILTFAIFQAVFVVMSNHDTSNKYCYKNSGPAVFWISAFLLIVSLMGLMASCCKSKSQETVYLWLMLVATIVGIAFTAFLFFTIPNESANDTYERTRAGDWLKAFSPLMRFILVNDRDWYNARACLVGMQFCEWFREHPPSLRLRYLRFLQIGCCEPPRRCGFLQRNETFWEIPKSGYDSQDKECQMWGASGNNGVCYDCDSCKAGYLAKFQMDWHADKGVFVTILVILIISTSLSFWTFGIKKETGPEKEQRKHRNMVFG